MSAVAPAYEHCRRVARESGSSFYTGMRLLPPDRRAALFAVYALARRIDDIADGELDPAEKLAELGRTRELLHRIGESDDPVLVAVADAAKRFPIPLDAFDDLIDGAELDVQRTEIVTFADLERYSRCVAGSIGRLALGVFECSDRERATGLADDLGVALQIGNTLRDVSEDVSNGRVYLPREDLERFGCTVRDGVFEGPIELVIAFGAQRGSAGSSAGSPWSPARPPQRRLRPRDGGQVPPPARPHRRRAVTRPARPALAPSLGEGPRARPQPDRSRLMRAADAASPRIAIVGGGLAGLAAAIECADSGATVTLYEARSRLGGATFSFERNGLWLDNGQHVALRCCTAYLGFLRRIGSDHLLPLQPRLRVPVLREGRRPALISRTGLPAPLHLASTLLRYAPLGARERLAAIRAAAALRALDPDDPALDEQTFGGWLRAHGQSPNAIAALWNLIALPTLNLPADEASLAAAVKVLPHRPPGLRRRLRHRRPGSAVPAAARRPGSGSARARRRKDPHRHACPRDHRRPEAASRRRGRRGDAVVVAVPHEAVAGLVPGAAVDAEAPRRARDEPDRQPPRPLQPPRARRAAGGGPRLARASGSSTGPKRPAPAKDS